MMKPCRLQAISLTLVGMLVLPACGSRAPQFGVDGTDR